MDYEMAERVGFEPTIPRGYTGFRDRRFRPLSHLSGIRKRGVFSAQRAHPIVPRSWQFLPARERSAWQTPSYHPTRGHGRLPIDMERPLVRIITGGEQIRSGFCPVPRHSTWPKRSFRNLMVVQAASNDLSLWRKFGPVRRGMGNFCLLCQGEVRAF